MAHAKGQESGYAESNGNDCLSGNIPLVLGLALILICVTVLQRPDRLHDTDQENDMLRKWGSEINIVVGRCLSVGFEAVTEMIYMDPYMGRLVVLLQDYNARI